MFLSGHVMLWRFTSKLNSSETDTLNPTLMVLKGHCGELPGPRCQSARRRSGCRGQSKRHLGGRAALGANCSLQRIRQRQERLNSGSQRGSFRHLRRGPLAPRCGQHELLREGLCGAAEREKTVDNGRKDGLPRRGTTKSSPEAEPLAASLPAKLRGCIGPGPEKAWHPKP